MPPIPNERTGLMALRWSLVLIFALFGIAKFAAYEAEGVARIAEHYWLFAWLYDLGGPRFASNTIGSLELATGLMIALGTWSRRAGLLGGLMGMATFAVTLSFILGTAIWEPGYGAPFIGGTTQFLIKDAVLLAGCFVLALDAARRLQSSGSGARLETVPIRVG